MPESHDHDHDHGPYGHQHAPKDFGRAFALGVALNLGFVAIEAGFGFFANSMALLADAGHNVSDVLGLIVAWSAAALSKRAPSRRFTYGLRGSSILAALANGVLLMAAVGAIAWEAFGRLAAPEGVQGWTVIWVAAAGVLVNGATAALFLSGRKGDLNVRGAYLHMAADAGVSLGVVVAGLAIVATGLLWIDPAVSLLVAAAIVWSTWGLLREATALSLAAVPPGVPADEVRAYLAALPGVARIHDLHIWPLSTTETALTCHLVMPGGHPGDRFLAETANALRHRFAIGHATLQIEVDAGAACALEPDHVV